MSHTTNTSENIRFHHNGDFSGDVIIVIPDDFKNEFGNTRITNDHGASFVQIPFADIRKLYLGYIRGKMVKNLEEMEDDDLEDWLMGTSTSGGFMDWPS